MTSPGPRPSESIFHSTKRLWLGQQRLVCFVLFLMKSAEQGDLMDTSIVDPRWKDLYKLAGIAAIVSEFVILLGIVTFFIWPYTPGSKTTEEILRLLQSDPLGGLVSLDLFLFVGNLFSIFGSPAYSGILAHCQKIW
jgi:hypothetical protein